MDKNKPEVRSDIDQIYWAVMADTEALEDAKMTLEVIKKTDPGVYDEMIDDTLSLIRKALSNSILGTIDRLVDPEEPVAWIFQHEDTGQTDCIDDQQVEWGFEKNNPRWQKIAPLYTTPPQRKWVGLTDNEHMKLAEEWGCLSADWVLYAEAVERKLKDKNNGL